MVEGFVETGLGGRDVCASGQGETSGHRCVHGGEDASGAKGPGMFVGFRLFRFMQ